MIKERLLKLLIDSVDRITFFEILFLVEAFAWLNQLDMTLVQKKAKNKRNKLDIFGAL